MTKRPAHELTPLVEDPSQPSYIRELLDAGRSARASGYDFERGQAEHLARLGSGAPMPEWARDLRPSGGGAPAAAAVLGAVGSRLLVWGAASLVVATAVTAAILMLDTEREPATGPAVTTHEPPSRSPSAVPARVAPRGAQEQAPANTKRVVEPERTLRPKQVSASSSSKVSAARSAATRTRLASPPSSSVPPVSAPAPTRSATTSNVAAEPSNVVEPLAKTQAQPPVAQPEEQAAERAKAARPAQPTPQDEERLEREMGMLAAAQRALHVDPTRALKLAQQGESEFRDSMFTQERQQLLLLALVKLSRLDEAKRLAKPYLQHFPHGPFSDRVRRALATGQVER